MRRWRSAFFSLTILGMLFFLGTAMAPTVGPAIPAEPVALVEMLEPPPGQQAPEPHPAWRNDYCSMACPGTIPDPVPLPFSPRVLVAESGIRSQQPRTPTPTPKPAPAPRPVEEWRSLVSAYFAAADVDRALTIIACESEGDPSARNPRSGAAGLFQHIPRYWEARTAAVGLPGASIFDPTANVAAAAWLLQNDGWAPWFASSGCWG